MANGLPDNAGHFGIFGGKYVPETLMSALKELEQEYDKACKDKKFQEELDYYLRDFAGRPSSLYLAEKLSREAGPGKVYLKREDLNHTGAHHINSDLPGFEIKDPVAGEGADGRLGRVVNGQRSEALRSPDRTVEDNRASIRD